MLISDQPGQFQSANLFDAAGKCGHTLIEELEEERKMLSGRIERINKLIKLIKSNPEAEEIINTYRNY